MGQKQLKFPCHVDDSFSVTDLRPEVQLMHYRHKKSLKMVSRAQNDRVSIGKRVR